MQLKKLLALLLSAALALSLLAGCGGESVARSLLALLDGKYANVSVEMDPDLEADLRQALSETENDDEAAIRAALETLLGSTITFRYLGEGQQGDTAFDLIFYAGADPDKAAQSAYSQWNGTFSNLPDDGLYTAALAQVQTENGVWLLVQATVDKAGTVDKPDKDDDEPEKPKQPYEVTGTNDNGQVTNVTVNTSNGLQNLLTKQNDEKPQITAARNSGFDGVTIELAAGETYTVSQTFTENNGTFKGILKGKSPDKKATINIADDCNGLFKWIESNGKVENITFDVQTNITDTYAEGGSNHFAGAVAGVNYGNITNCDVTINIGCTIQTTKSPSFATAGGLVGSNCGTITACTVTINGSITATGNDIATAGGLVGSNCGTITACTVTINGSITATGNDIATAGGIAGDNQGEGEIKGNSQVTIGSGGSIQATGTTVRASAGGLAGQNVGTVDDTCSFMSYDLEKTITAQAGKSEASVPDPTDTNTPNTDTQGSAYAGTKIGFDFFKANGPVG